MPAAMAMGEASGVAASIAISAGIDLRDIDVNALQSKLIELGAIID